MKDVRVPGSVNTTPGMSFYEEVVTKQWAQKAGSVGVDENDENGNSENAHAHQCKPRLRTKHRNTPEFEDITNTTKSPLRRASPFKKASKSPLLASPSDTRHSKRLVQAGRDAVKPLSPLDAYKVMKAKRAKESRNKRRAKVKGVTIKASLSSRESPHSESGSTEKSDDEEDGEEDGVQHVPKPSFSEEKLEEPPEVEKVMYQQAYIDNTPQRAAWGWVHSDTKLDLSTPAAHAHPPALDGEHPSEKKNVSHSSNGMYSRSDYAQDINTYHGVYKKDNDANAVDAHYDYSYGMTEGKHSEYSSHETEAYAAENECEEKCEQHGYEEYNTSHPEINYEAQNHPQQELYTEYEQEEAHAAKNMYEEKYEENVYDEYKVFPGATQQAEQRLEQESYAGYKQEKMYQEDA